MTAKPYIGITGIKTGKEVLALNDALADAGILSADKEHPTHTAMYGFIVTDKRLANPSKSGTQSPALNDLEHLLSLVPRGVIPMLHYFTNTEGAYEIAKEVIGLFNLNEIYQKGLCRAVQLNGAWSNKYNNCLMPGFADDLYQVKAAHHKMQVVLQIPKKVIESNTPEQITKLAHMLGGTIDYLLVDASGGKGVEFDEMKSLEIMHALDQTVSDVRIGIAGGFSEKNVFERVQKLTAAFDYPFCIDAQGKLRTPDKEHLDIDKTKRYFTWASLAFERAKS